MTSELGDSSGWMPPLGTVLDPRIPRHDRRCGMPELLQASCLPSPHLAFTASTTSATPPPPPPPPPPHIPCLTTPMPLLHLLLLLPQPRLSLDDLCTFGAFGKPTSLFERCALRGLNRLDVNEARSPTPPPCSPPPPLPPPHRRPNQYHTRHPPPPLATAAGGGGAPDRPRRVLPPLRTARRDELRRARRTARALVRRPGAHGGPPRGRARLPRAGCGLQLRAHAGRVPQGDGALCRLRRGAAAAAATREQRGEGRADAALRARGPQQGRQARLQRVASCLPAPPPPAA